MPFRSDGGWGKVPWTRRRGEPPPGGGHPPPPPLGGPPMDGPDWAKLIIALVAGLTAVAAAVKALWAALFPPGGP